VEAPGTSEDIPDRIEIEAAVVATEARGATRETG